MGGIFAGLAFTIIVTRQLEPEEFGAWTVLGSMMSYAVITESIISYWTTRQVARGKPVGSTSMVSSGIFAGGSIPIYIVSVYLFANIRPEFFDSMMLATILIPAQLIRGCLSSINLGYKPHGVSIGLAVFQAVKIPAGLGLVYMLELGLDGAILAVFAAHLFEICVLLCYAWPKVTTALNMSYLKGWIRQFWMPIYNSMQGVLQSLDVLLYTVITGSVLGVAYYAAASVVYKVVERAGSITQGLYPKLLASGSQEYVTENLRWMMYFAIPMLVLGVLFSKHGLFLLNAVYVDAWMAGVLLAFNGFVQITMHFLHQVLTGTDTVDVNERPRMSDLLKSKLFLVGTLGNMRIVLYLAVLAVVLLAMNHEDEVELVRIWATLMLAISIPFALYYAILVKKHAPFSLPHTSIIKQVVGAASMACVFMLTNEHIVVFEENLLLYLPGLLLELAICSAAYLAITYVIDAKTRMLFGMIVSEIAPGRRNSN